MSEFEREMRTILMVDDHEENLKVLAEILAPEGYDLIPANCGEQAFRRLEKRIPDLILLDVVLPDINGVEICRRLKERADCKDVPVIFLSASDDKELVVEALESGGVDYIAKPFNQAELLTRVRTHLDLKSARDSLRLLAADKDQLLRVMAHDFKSQISGVLMSAKLLLDREECQKLPERSLKLVHNMRESSERMMGFMKSFLANQERKKQPIKIREIDFGKLVRSVIAETEPAAMLKQTEIRYSEPLADWKLLADENAARQVLENLIFNAVKFCEPGSSVDLSYRLTDGGAMEVLVCDDGPGFSTDDKKRMFERYSRLSAKPSGGEPSTGLGLYIVKGLMEDMGGKVRLEDTEQGACFVLTFKARKRSKTQNS
jgi:two-component system sensor histidine kinase/response regulator